MARSETTFTIPPGLIGPKGLLVALLVWAIRDASMPGTSAADRRSAIAFCQSELGNALAVCLASRLGMETADDYPLRRLLERLDIDTGERPD